MSLPPEPVRFTVANPTAHIYRYETSVDLHARGLGQPLRLTHGRPELGEPVDYSWLGVRVLLAWEQYWPWLRFVRVEQRSLSFQLQGLATGQPESQDKLNQLLRVLGHELDRVLHGQSVSTHHDS